MVDLSDDIPKCNECSRKIKNIIEDGVFVADSEEDARANPPICKLLCHKCYKISLAYK